MTECIDNYLRMIYGRGSSRAHWNKLLIAQKIQREIGDVPINEMTPAKTAEYINSLPLQTYQRGDSQQRYSQNYIDKIYTLLKCVFNSAIKENIITENPMNDLKRPISRKEPVDDMQPFTEEQIRHLLKIAEHDPVFRAQIIIFWYAGIRPGEMWALKFSDFDRVKGTIRIQRALSVEKEIDGISKKVVFQQPIIKLLKNEYRSKKNFARRELAMGEAVFNAIDNLRRYISADEKQIAARRKYNTDGYLFAGEKGQIVLPDTYTNSWRRKITECGLTYAEYNPYRFRHTFCTRLFKTYHLDPKTVQRMMGDNDMEMVMRV